MHHISSTGLVLEITHYLTPVLLIVLFVAAFITRTIIAARKAAAENELGQDPPQTGPGGKPLPPSTTRAPASTAGNSAYLWTAAQIRFFFFASCLVLLTLLADAAVVVLHALKQRSEKWWCGESYVVYVTMTFFLYSLVLCSMRNLHPAPNNIHALTWSVSLVLEVIMLAASMKLYIHPHRQRRAFHPHKGRMLHGITAWESVQITIDLVRVLTLALVLLVFFVLVHVHRRRHQTAERESVVVVVDSEITPLLNGNSQQHKHAESEARDKARPRWARPEKLPEKSWWEYIRGYSMFVQYIWPGKAPQLQVALMLCLILLGLARVVNVLVPTQAGKITDLLAGENGLHPEIPWVQIALYILFRLLQGQSGLLTAARNMLYLPISQYSSRELSVAAFEHVHSLSLDFHLGKKTGEVISALNKGSSISSFLQQITFDVLPMMVDLVVAIIFFISKFDVYYGLIVTLTSFTYMYVTVLMAQQRAQIRREYANLSRNVEAVKNDSLVSYETVKYFNAEPYEFNRYRGVLNQLQKSEFQVVQTLQYMNLTQNLLFMLGVMGVCFLSAFEIAIGKQPVGQFVTLLTYMSQLQAPLNYFGTAYRSIQSSLISSERMLELFKERPTVVDPPDARSLDTCNGDIRFNNVQFSYDPRRRALKGLTFECKAGTTTAFVGESGGGKSTIFRLLFRFYNADGGSIELDGVNVQDVKIDSLRSHMGVVPQDTVLFNETIMYNLKYANQHATDEQVYSACKAASIHDRILAFPDGYESKVGERGLKLSGGEKQRIAIARTIIKNPRIILLDEATAALDTATEQNIQGALDTLSQGRTNLIIAHRLSTITNANQILVIQNGEIVERGTHDELLHNTRKPDGSGGVYAKMWDRQIRAQKAAEKARSLDRKAAAATVGVTTPGSSSSKTAASSGMVGGDSSVRHSLHSHSHSHTHSHSSVSTSGAGGTGTATRTGTGHGVDDAGYLRPPGALFSSSHHDHHSRTLSHDIDAGGVTTAAPSFVSSTTSRPPSSPGEAASPGGGSGTRPDTGTGTGGHVTPGEFSTTASDNYDDEPDDDEEEEEEEGRSSAAVENRNGGERGYFDRTHQGPNEDTDDNNDRVERRRSGSVPRRRLSQRQQQRRRLQQRQREEERQRERERGGGSGSGSDARTDA